jgi:hypothetical protein
MTGDLSAAPEASQAVIESAVRQALGHLAGRGADTGTDPAAERLILLRAAPQWRGEPAITVESPQGQIIAYVRGCATVLAVLDALSEDRDPRSYLVVLTPCADRELGDSVTARAIGHEVRPVDRWDLVLEAFGARRLDPVLLRADYRWLAEALLEAQPGGGWRRTPGLVLPAGTALGRLAALRLGRGGEGEQLDAAALLDWSRDESQVARFVSLRQEERDGLAAWLESTAGPVAGVVFGLLREGQVTDTIPFGLVVAELYGTAAGRAEPVLMARARAEQRFLGGRPAGPAGLTAFGEAAESLILRWGENGHAADALAMCDRAEQILAELGAPDVAAGSALLRAGLEARLTELAEAVAAVLPAPRPADLPAVEAALARLREHRRAAAHEAQAEAEAAVRLVRWLAAQEDPPATVAAAVAGQVRSWAWADRALAVIVGADTSRTPRAQVTYVALATAVRGRRAELDRAAADRLAAWSPAGGGTQDLLLAENVLARVARPLAAVAAPLVIVVDGMTAAVGCALAEEISGLRTWEEVGRHGDGREGALTALPSVTAVSRASLLSGDLRAGSQAQEREGFAALWSGRRAVLFHKADLPARPGARLSDVVLGALAEPSAVVGVVLNTIDDALHGKDGTELDWRLADITHLSELLAAAAGAGRPVLLTSDHGHVRDRNDGIRPVAAESARWREGSAGDGEIAVAGPRVLAGGGAVVLPWDERIRYVPRRAGYHGGAALAEIVIPVLAFVPANAAAPKGWTRYRALSPHEPAWWNPPAGTGPAAADSPASPRPAAASRGAGRKAMSAPASADTLFTDADIPVPASLGSRVTGSELYQAQRAFVRKAPSDTEAAAAIDALDRAGGKLPVTALAGAAGQPPFRMPGFLAQLSRLLNVDGYPVISVTDDNRTAELNAKLAREQFLGGSG